MSNAATRLSNERLRRERQRRGWSREYVAEQIGIADVKTIGRWERGVAFPRAYFLQKLCALFGMLAQDLGLYMEDSNSLPTTEPLQTPQDSNISLSAPHLYDPTIPLPHTEDGLVGRDELLDLLKQQPGRRTQCVVRGQLAREDERVHDLVQQFGIGGR